MRRRRTGTHLPHGGCRRRYREKYGKVPSYYSESNYTTAQMIHEVMKQTRGKWPGAQEFVKLLASVKVEAVRGPVSLDEMRNPVQNVYIKTRRVQP